MNEHYIVIFRDSYADEFNLESFQIFTKEHWNDEISGINQSDDREVEIYFGTNEYIIISPKQFFGNILVIELSAIEYDIINNTLGSWFGTIYIDNILERFKLDDDE